MPGPERGPAFRVACPGCHAPVLLAGARPGCPGCGRPLASIDGVIVLDEEPAGDDYPAELYELVAPVEEHHWWHASRNEVIRLALMPEATRRGLTTLLEVGCGTGFVLAHLERLGFTVCGLDMHLNGLRLARWRTAAPLLRSGRPDLPLADPVDVLALCDVLEHADEAPLLDACRRALAPRGLLLVTVPARPSLWSREDELVGHRRRYTAATLRRALGGHGFRVLCVRPFHSLVTLPALWRARRRGGRPGRPVEPGEVEAWFGRAPGPPSPWKRRLMGGLLAVENRLGRWLPLPFASSLLALAEPDQRP